MKSYQYIKVTPITVTVPVLPLLSISLGFSILIWVIWPILSFQLFYAKATGYIVTPLSEDFLALKAQEISGSDLSKASAWFPKQPVQTTDSPVSSYELSIPKLRINRALVKIGTDDLSESIIHYGGTGLPGKYGNAVLFGHSILPQFYNPQNYLSIFSLLPQLKEEDDIYVHFDGVDYKYKIISMRVTDPGDVTGLEQRYDGSYITLVTCVPPGTYLKRLWVTAKQTSFGK